MRIQNIVTPVANIIHQYVRIQHMVTPVAEYIIYQSVRIQNIVTPLANISYISLCEYRIW